MEYQSNYDYENEYANQGHYKSSHSSRSADISGGEAYGALNSKIDLGSGNNNATVNVLAGKPSHLASETQALMAAMAMTASALTSTPMVSAATTTATITTTHRLATTLVVQWRIQTHGTLVRATIATGGGATIKAKPI